MLKLSIAILLFSLGFGLNAVAGVKVVASIPPVYALTAAVMHGVEKPKMLVNAGTSPHTYAMKPSDAKKIAEADVIFMISPDMETFMAKAVKDNNKVIYLADTKGITLLPTRVSEHEHSHGLNDLHIWLNYQNAIKMVQRIAEVLARVDKENAHIYAENAKNEIAKINALAVKTAKTLQGLKTKAFLVYHDAGQYFEKQNNLHGAVVVLAHEGVPLGVKQRMLLKQQVTEQKINCLMVEPWANDEKVTKLANDLGVKAVEINPLGSGLYIDSMKNIVSAYKKCLEQ